VIDALVFDFDGLVLDTETCSYESVAAVFAAHGAPLDRSWWQYEILGGAEHPHWSVFLEERATRPIADIEKVKADRLVHHHALVAQEIVCPGVVELLDEAAASGVPCAIASSSSHGWVDGHLDRLGLLERFAVVRCGDDVAPGRTKPAPDIFLAACAALDVDPVGAVALEDSPNGVAAAAAAGLTVVGVAAGMTAGLPLLGAHRVVTSLTEVRLADLAALAEHARTAARIDP
jgi:HAD superfamily hydrolase (TIGR01509 family)